jgi:hypothetical protein
MVIGDGAIPGNRFPEGGKVDTRNRPEENEATFVNEFQGARMVRNTI